MPLIERKGARLMSHLLLPIAKLTVDDLENLFQMKSSVQGKPSCVAFESGVSGASFL